MRQRAAVQPSNAAARGGGGRVARPLDASSWRHLAARWMLAVVFGLALAPLVSAAQRQAHALDLASACALHAEHGGACADRGERHLPLVAGPHCLLCLVSQYLAPLPPPAVGPNVAAGVARVAVAHVLRRPAPPDFARRWWSEHTHAPPDGRA